MSIYDGDERREMVIKYGAQYVCHYCKRKFLSYGELRGHLDICPAREEFIRKCQLSRGKCLNSNQLSILDFINGGE